MYVNYIRFVCTNCNTQRHLDSEQIEKRKRECHISPYLLIIGTDVALIAECLGLDPTGYKRSLAADENSSASCVVLKEQVSYYRGDIFFLVKTVQL